MIESFGNIYSCLQQRADDPKKSVYLDPSKGILAVRDLNVTLSKAYRDGFGAHIVTCLQNPGYVGLTEIKAFEKMVDDLLAKDPGAMGDHAAAVKARVAAIKKEALVETWELKIVVECEAALARVKRLHGSQTHPDVATSLDNLGMVRHSLGQHESAIQLLQQALAMRIQIYGHTDPHPDVAMSFNNLGLVHHSLGRHKLATELFQHADAMYPKMKKDD